jgi:hypothetical protein
MAGKLQPQLGRKGLGDRLEENRAGLVVGKDDQLRPQRPLLTCFHAASLAEGAGG